MALSLSIVFLTNASCYNVDIFMHILIMENINICRILAFLGLLRNNKVPWASENFSFVIIEWHKFNLIEN